MLHHRLPETHQRRGERLARLVVFSGRLLQLLEPLGERRDALVVEPAHLGSRQSALVDAQIVQRPLQMLAGPTTGRDERRHVLVDGDHTGTFLRANLHAVQIDAHHLAVKSGCRVMPAPVKNLGRIDLRVTFNVPVDIQTQRQDRPAVLEREQQPLRTLLAKQLPVVGQLDRLDPDREGNLRQRGGCGQRRSLQLVRSRQFGGHAVDATHARHHHRLLCSLRVVVDVVKSPVPQERRVNRGRRSLTRAVRGPSR